MQSQTLAAWLETQDVARLNRYREYLDFYGGEQWNTRRRPGETRLVFNYARVLLRKSVSYLMPGPVMFDVLPDASTTPGATEATEATVRLAERALRQVYDAHDQHTVDFQSALDAAVLGDGAFKVTWSVRKQAPLVAPVDPASLWVWWEPDNPGEIYRVAQRYTVSADEADRLFGVAPGSEPGAGQKRVAVVEDWTTERYRIEMDGQTVVDAENPYGRIP